MFKNNYLYIILTILIFFIILFFSILTNNPEIDIDLFPANKKSFSNKWGFIDKNGNFIITPTFDEVSTFQNGLAAYKLNDKWGFINKTGKIIIKAQFADVKYFSENMAPVTLNNENWFYIDKYGYKINDETYFYAGIFKNQKAVISTKIDKIKTIISADEYFKLDIIDDKFKIINIQDFLFHEPKNGDFERYISNYNNDYISLIQRDYSQNNLILIKSNKAFKTYPFSSSFDKWRLGNATGEKIPTRFNNDYQAYWRYDSLNNSTSSPIQYLEAGDFIDGKAPVLENYYKDWAYIDKNEKILFTINQGKEWIPFLRSSENNPNLSLKNKLVFYNHNLSIIPLFYCSNRNADDTYKKIDDIKYIDQLNNVIYPNNLNTNLTKSFSSLVTSTSIENYEFYSVIFLFFTFCLILIINPIFLIILFHSNFSKYKFWLFLFILTVQIYYVNFLSYFVYLIFYNLYKFNKINHEIISYLSWFFIIISFTLIFIRKFRNQGLSILILAIILLTANYFHAFLGFLHIDDLEKQIVTITDYAKDKNDSLVELNNYKLIEIKNKWNDFDKEEMKPLIDIKFINRVPRAATHPHDYIKKYFEFAIEGLKYKLLLYFFTSSSKIITQAGSTSYLGIKTINVIIRISIIFTMFVLINYALYIIIRISATINSYKPIAFNSIGNNIKYEIFNDKSININSIKTYLTYGTHLLVSKKMNYLSGGSNLSNINSFSLFSLGSIIARVFHMQLFFKSVPIQSDINLRISNIDTFILLKLENNDTILYDMNSLVAFENTIKLGTYFDLINFFSIHSWILKKHFFYFLKGPGLVILKAKNSTIEVDIDANKNHKEIINNIVFLPQHCQIYSYVPEQPLELYTNYDYCIVESPTQQKLVFQNIDHERSLVFHLCFPFLKILKFIIVP